MANLKTHFAELLLKIKAVEVNPDEPFTYASGIKGPIYCDNRKILSHPDERRQVRDGFRKILKEKEWEFDQLAGLATAGIAHAALVAEAENVPMVYVRSKPKAHGKGQQIEGDFKSGQKIVLIEDLINQGSSLDDAMYGVQNSGLVARGCLAIVSYQMLAASEVYAKWNLHVETLTDFDTICIVAEDKGLISEAGRRTLMEWRNDPRAWWDKRMNN